MKEIILSKEARDKLKSGINKLASAVLATYGPNGKTVIISDEWGQPYITKDGVSVAKSVFLKDPIENIGAQLIKEVAANTLDEAGDGTTTSICLANAFINNGYELLKQGKSYKDIQKDLDDILEYVPKHLKKSSIKVEKDNIYHVAKVSANGDDQMANIIQEAFNHSKIVKVEEGNLEEDVLSTYSGIKVGGGIFDKAFINNPGKQSIDYDKSKLIVVDGKVEKMEQIAHAITNEKPIIILAEHVNDQVIRVLRDNFNRGSLKIGVAKAPGFSKHRKDLMEDIRCYTGAIKGGKDISIADIEGVTITKDSLTIRKDKPESDKLLSDLKEAYKEDNNNKLLKERIDNLEGSLSIIRVGGKSELEMKERKDRIEDAVLAVQCALEEGVVIGAGSSLLDIANHPINKDKPMWKCLEVPSTTIKGESEYLIIDIAHIVDPVKVIRCALQNAVSVAKTILSTEAIVLNETQWK